MSQMLLRLTRRTSSAQDRTNEPVEHVNVAEILRLRPSLEWPGTPGCNIVFSHTQGGIEYHEDVEEVLATLTHRELATPVTVLACVPPPRLPVPAETAPSPPAVVCNPFGVGQVVRCIAPEEERLVADAVYTVAMISLLGIKLAADRPHHPLRDWRHFLPSVLPGELGSGPYRHLQQFRGGQLVKCLDASPPVGGSPHQLPLRHDALYRVTTVNSAGFYIEGSEFGWLARRFQPATREEILACDLPRLSTCRGLQVGDVVQCLDDHPRHGEPQLLELGRCYRIAELASDTIDVGDGRGYWASQRFTFVPSLSGRVGPAALVAASPSVPEPPVAGFRQLEFSDPPSP